MPSTGTLLKDMSKIQTKYFIMQNWDEYIPQTTHKIIDKVEESLMPIYDLKATGEFKALVASTEDLIKSAFATSNTTSEIGLQKEFIVISENPKYINLTDLVESRIQKDVIPPKLTKKLNSIIRDLQKTEPKLYKALLEDNAKIDIEEIISFLEFTGTDALPKTLDIVRLFDELKLVHTHG